MRVDDLAKLDAVVSALGNALEGEIDFIVTDPTDERAAATAIALRARPRPRRCGGGCARPARAADPPRRPQPGVRHRVRRHDDSENAAGGGGEPVDVEVEVGQNEIGAAVAVVYEIGP